MHMDIVVLDRFLRKKSELSMLETKTPQATTCILEYCDHTMSGYMYSINMFSKKRKVNTIRPENV